MTTTVTLKSNRNNKNLTKDNVANTGTRTCRCTGKSTTSETSRIGQSTTTTSTKTNISMLRNPKDLPVREFEKLSPIPINNYTNSARCNSSSVNSTITDASGGVNAHTSSDTTTAITRKSTIITSSNQKNLVVRNSVITANNQIDNLLKNDVSNSNTNIEMVNLNVLNNKNLKKLIQNQPQYTSNGSEPISTTNKLNCTTEDNFSNSTGGTNIVNNTSNVLKTINTDDTLILRICDLEYATRRSSSSYVTNNRASCATEKIIVKTKVRTKTVPNPISSPHKQRRFSSTTTSTIDLKNYQKCSPRSGSGIHNASKCNCSSCNINVKQVNTHSSTNCHSKTKSVGTQHDANSAFDPWIKQNSTSDPHSSNTSTTITNNAVLNQKIANSNAKVIVITDAFKKKALNQEVLVDTKRKILRYMKANKLLNSSRSMDDVRIANNEIDIAKDVNINEHQMNTSILSIDKTGDDKDTTKMNMKKAKAISKSVDNVSILSTDMDALDNVGSVELIFISDEFLNKVSEQDVIILKNSTQIQMASRKASSSGKCVNGNTESNGKNAPACKQQIVVISDEFRRKSIQDKQILIVDEPKRNGNGSYSGTNKPKLNKLNRQSSAESSVDDVNNTYTSRAFQSYDEEPEHLESKEIQTPTVEEIIL